MRRLALVFAMLVLHGVAAAQDGKGDLTVGADGKCSTTIPKIQCPKGPQGQCKNGKSVWWSVENKNSKDAVVALVAFKHVATGWYIDPMVGPGSNGIHSIDVVAGKKQVLKMKVRKMEYFLGEYDYKVAVKFQGEATFSICLDPRIDIGN